MDWGGHDPASPVAEMCHGLYKLNSFRFILDLDILDSFRFLCLFSSEFIRIPAAEISIWLVPVRFINYHNTAWGIMIFVA